MYIRLSMYFDVIIIEIEITLFNNVISKWRGFSKYFSHSRSAIFLSLLYLSTLLSEFTFKFTSLIINKSRVEVHNDVFP